MKGWDHGILFKEKMNMKNQSSNAPALTEELNSRFLVRMSHFFCFPSVTDGG